MKKKKMLLIGFGEGYGGLEKATFSWCSLLQNDYDFEFLSYYRLIDITKEKIERMNCNHYRVSRYSKKFFSYVREIYSFYHSHNKYDIIYCNANHASVILYTLPVLFRRTPKIVFHSHAGGGNCVELQKILRILVNRKCDLKIACSEGAAKWMYGTDRNVKIVYNGIDTEKYKFNPNVRIRLREQYKIEDELVIGYFSRLCEGKNHRFLIEIFSEIIKMGKKARLLIIGDGELKDEIIKQLEQLKLTDQTILLPFQENIQDYYNMADIFVFPSIYVAEAFPLIGIEAQTNGLPTLMSDRVPQSIACTPLADFESVNSTAKRWAEKIMGMKENSEREQYCEIVARAGFDQREMAKKIDSLLQEL